MDGDNYFYFVGAVKDINSTFTITIDNDGDGTAAPITFNVVIAADTILGQ